jgi:hypothetical protein
MSRHIARSKQLRANLTGASWRCSQRARAMLQALKMR